MGWPYRDNCPPFSPNNVSMFKKISKKNFVLEILYFGRIWDKIEILSVHNLIYWKLAAVLSENCCFLPSP